MTSGEPMAKEISEDLRHRLLEKIETIARDVKEVRDSLGETIAPLGDPAIHKIVVAIHGIGDQYRNATVQSVVNIFGRCFEQAAAVPLGAFYSSDGTVEAFRLKPPPDVNPGIGDIGFVEAYWADIPRRVQQHGYTIEETKAWARTAVEHVRARYGPFLQPLVNARNVPSPSPPPKAKVLSDEDYLSAAAVIEEMIDAIAVLGSLCFLAEKAGLFRINLDNLLTSYVGDVQIVADFANYREVILRQFRAILDAVHERNPTAQIYLIAHSEGTVVAFMGLLQAMSSNPPKWIDQVRGFMTFGSPIDKHILLWPEMWQAVQKPAVKKRSSPIKWRNYYDYGDPIGFELNTARTWLETYDWNKVNAFEFRVPIDQKVSLLRWASLKRLFTRKKKKKEPTDDMGFSRYFVPGKAHNDYWNDPCVFKHFIRNVILSPVEANGKNEEPPPPNRWTAQLSSYITPFLLIAAILYVAVYIAFTACNSYANIAEPWSLVIRDVFGISSLLAGVTIFSRIPCLTRSTGYKLLAGFGFAVASLLYITLRTNWFIDWPPFIPKGQHDEIPLLASNLTATVALLLGLVAVFVSILADRQRSRLQKYPPVRLFARGARPLLIAGGAGALILAVNRITGSPALDANAKGIWSVLVGGASFVYLWWLAICLFDLTFTWHRYIRNAVWQKYLAEARPRRIAYEQKAAEKQTAPPIPNAAI